MTPDSGVESRGELNIPDRYCTDPKVRWQAGADALEKELGQASPDAALLKELYTFAERAYQDMRTAYSDPILKRAVMQFDFYQD